MKAVRVHAYKQDPQIDDIPEPTIQGPLDVIVKIGGAGVCRTDLHIIDGDWADIQNPDLPYVIGHENAGWVHAVGDGVTNVAVGDTVILHPQPSCGLCTMLGEGIVSFGVAVVTCAARYSNAEAKTGSPRCTRLSTAIPAEVKLFWPAALRIATSTRPEVFVTPPRA